MTRLRILAARVLRWWAARIDAMHVDTAEQRGAMSLSAAQVRLVAQRLDPYVATCAVCSVPLTRVECEPHGCSVEALADFTERARLYAEAGGVEA